MSEHKWLVAMIPGVGEIAARAEEAETEGFLWLRNVSFLRQAADQNGRPMCHENGAPIMQAHPWDIERQGMSEGPFVVARESLILLSEATDVLADKLDALWGLTKIVKPSAAQVAIVGGGK